MGETARALGKRLVEHQKQTTSAVQEHHSKATHEIDWEGVKIFDQETVDIKRKTQGGHPYQTPASNPKKRWGYELPAILNHLLSRDLFTWQYWAFTADEECEMHSKATRLKSETFGTRIYFSKCNISLFSIIRFVAILLGKLLYHPFLKPKRSVSISSASLIERLKREIQCLFIDTRWCLTVGKKILMRGQHLKLYVMN